MLDEEEDTCHKDSPDESGSKGNSIKPKHTRLPSTTPSMASLITCTLNACVCVRVCVCVCVCVCLCVCVHPAKAHAVSTFYTYNPTTLNSTLHGVIDDLDVVVYWLGLRV